MQLKPGADHAGYPGWGPEPKPATGFFMQDYHSHFSAPSFCFSVYCCPDITSYALAKTINQLNDAYVTHDILCCFNSCTTKAASVWEEEWTSLDIQSNEMISIYHSEKLTDTVMTVSFRQPLPLLDNDILRTFVAIAETGNFSTAAEVVFRTPSAVSMQIKKLEEQLKTTLFLRDARSVTLTAHGETLLTYARRMIALSNEAVSRFVMPDLSGVVKLGAPDDLGQRGLLPGILKRFAEAFPAIMVDVTIDSSSQLYKRIDEQRLDLALVNCASHPLRDTGEVLMRERLVWAGAKCGTAHLRDPLPISIWEDGCIWRSEAINALDKRNRPYRVAYLSGHTMAQRAAIEADLAIAPLPRSYVQNDMVILGEREGLPPLGSFDIRLIMTDKVSRPIQAVADSIRNAFRDVAQVGEARDIK
ncbi:DNA-binding transcriptional LysR family regulator [Agrobacterium larrymoorei]|uniref:DNA-binding transcriptional LysR family regulator n=3 Tax=Rhizobium/Agrobacterium group TaxID=227290 RepID=A0ABU0UM23_9HYPH|nr:DNA-binding transcriptional LysR family regulator [Agrobacterium larrymoorei]